MRVRHTVNVRIAEDNDMENLFFGPSDNLAEVTKDEYDQQASGTFKILQGTNEDINLKDVDNVKGIYIRFDKDCTLKLNGSADGIDLKKGTNANFSFGKFFVEANISQVNLAAPVDEDMTGFFCIWGVSS